MLNSEHGNGVLADEEIRNSTDMGPIYLCHGAGGVGGNERKAEMRDRRVRVKHVHEVKSVVARRGFQSRPRSLIVMHLRTRSE